MAAELERLRQDVRALAKKFKDAGQTDLAELLDVDARGFGTKAKIARDRGVLTFVLPTGKTAVLTPKSPQEQIQASLGFLDLDPEQVVCYPDRITESTRAYVGDLVHRDGQGKIVPIFERLRNVDYIYTEQGKRIPHWRLEIGGKSDTADGLVSSIEDVGMRVSDWAKDIMRTQKFAEALRADAKPVDLVLLEVSDLGYAKGGTTKQIFGRGNELGLDLCDSRVGPYQRMADRDQEMNTWYWIAMDPMTGSGGDPHVFGLERSEGGIWLDGAWMGPGHRWHPGRRVVFSLRK